MTDKDMVASLRKRLNDQGDDTQNLDGSLNRQYFWATDTEIAVYLNVAQLDIFRLLVDMDKRNELKNLIATTTLSNLSGITDYYHAFAAFIDGRYASLFIDPRGLSHISQNQELAVTVIGFNVIRNTGASHTIYYFRHPSTLVCDPLNPVSLNEMTDAFYDTVIDWAEYMAIHKDLARARIVLRRDYGKQDIQVEAVIQYAEQAS